MGDRSDQQHAAVVQPEGQRMDAGAGRRLELRQLVEARDSRVDRVHQLAVRLARQHGSASEPHDGGELDRGRPAMFVHGLRVHGRCVDRPAGENGARARDRGRAGPQREHRGRITGGGSRPPRTTFGSRSIRITGGSPRHARTPSRARSSTSPPRARARTHYRVR